MGYFAKVRNDIVEQVIVAEQDFIDELPPEDGVTWLETDYDMREGVNQKGGRELRKNYAGVGYEYHSDIDAFIPPKPYSKFVLNEQKGVYEAPRPMPPIDVERGVFWRWDDDAGDWVQHERPGNAPQNP